MSSPRTTGRFLLQADAADSSRVQEQCPASSEFLTGSRAGCHGSHTAEGPKSELRTFSHFSGPKSPGMGISA